MNKKMSCNRCFIVFLIAASISLASCCRDAASPKIEIGYITHVKRFGMVTGLKPEKIAYYKKLHAAAWPAVLKQIRTSNIRNYSIYLQKIEDKYYLFSYFEYVGKDFAADMKKMAADSTTRRWWKETDPTQMPLPGAAAKNTIWTDMQEVFHTP